MSLDESRRSQRPYRYGMVLLCVGALINWLGLAENYVEPVRYIGVACIVAGALLICAAMCCWLHSPPTRTNSQTSHANQPTTAQVRHFLFSVIGESVYLSRAMDRSRRTRRMPVLQDQSRSSRSDDDQHEAVTSGHCVLSCPAIVTMSCRVDEHRVSSRCTPRCSAARCFSFSMRSCGRKRRRKRRGGVNYDSELRFDCLSHFSDQIIYDSSNLWLTRIPMNRYVSFFSQCRNGTRENAHQI